MPIFIDKINFNVIYGRNVPFQRVGVEKNFYKGYAPLLKKWICTEKKRQNVVLFVEQSLCWTEE